MKTIILNSIAIIAFGISACNNIPQSATSETTITTGNSDQSEHVEHVAVNDADHKAITPLFSDLSPEVSSSIKQIVDYYINVSAALGNDDNKEAASSGMALSEIINHIDKSAFNEEQRSLYAKNENALKEHATVIASNANNIEVQRDSFKKMSEQVYALVSAFGGGRKLYKAHCPMVDANWLTEKNEVRNPYYGESMLTCGSIDELVM
ncbi:DUF3347 domain-containing protein [Albibacterium sp.]|uniref:DUF3347 domain-containing protein n=1 Tax=Albibacterium sp. TaxID=2952885 RepID=UPI002C1C1AC9|nr:DUF3347 domain-containing protein [Albibacterium sp.]HUH19187.1 DUF3347 domain-containing protein [Albibacterium sp.]